MEIFITSVQHSISHAIMITAFVAMMMVVIEYLNVFTKGLWQKKLRGGQWKQYFLAAFLGATPGCLGAFAAVSLYSHREISLGAVVAAMIATSGDESFVMLTMIPQQAPLIFGILFLIAILAAFITDRLFPPGQEMALECSHELHFHDENHHTSFSLHPFTKQWQHCSFARGILTLSLALFLFAVVTGQLGPDAWNWIRITLVVVALTALFIVTTVPDHFLEEHLWQHVIVVHVPRVFMWTFGALLLMHFMLDQLHLETWLHENPLIILLVACLVGLIPESGPHLIFLTFYAEGSIPLSVFMASSVVQDGHGMLPLLAESRKDFFKVKTLNFIVGLLLGLTGYFAGW